MHVKGANGKVIMGGYEHDIRAARSTDRLNYVEAGFPWHLDIEKHQVGRIRPHCFNRLTRIATLGDYLDVRGARQQRSNAPTRQIFIVHNDRPHRHRRFSVAALLVPIASDTRNGSRTTIEKPPEADRPIDRAASSP